MKQEKQAGQAAGTAMGAAASKAQWIAQNIKDGELYVGLILGAPGEHDYHLVLLPGEAVEVTWADAKSFASKAGGYLPSRREQSLLFANQKGEFKPNWYWSGEQHAAGVDYAWGQVFDGGFQNDYSKSARLRARAVRRLIIQ